MTRRVLLGTGAAVAGGAAFVGGAQLTGRLDDVADAVGLDPKPEADPRDTRLLRRAGVATGSISIQVAAVVRDHPTLAAPLSPIVTIATDHADALGVTPRGDADPVPAEPSAALGALAELLSTQATSRAGQAERAVSPDLARVLASMSAGLALAAVVVGDLR